jgi:hypothetical protein
MFFFRLTTCLYYKNYNFLARAEVFKLVISFSIIYQRVLQEPENSRHRKRNYAHKKIEVLLWSFGGGIYFGVRFFRM